MSQIIFRSGVDIDIFPLDYVTNNKEEEKIQELRDYMEEQIKANIEEINSLISNNLKDNWSLNRISKINLSLIKIAIFEMVYQKLPYKVAINEVIELAKRNIISRDQVTQLISAALQSAIASSVRGIPCTSMDAPPIKISV